MVIGGRPQQQAAVTRREFLHGGGVAIASLALADAASAAATPTRGAVPTPGATTKVLRVLPTTLNPDGRQDVAGITVDGTLPGPEIRVREGDLVRLQLENHLPDAPTLIHWHGLLLPAAMDGVPDVSVAPVAPGRMFVYEYPIRQSGTYWYHSHVGFQEQRGLAAAFVIEPRRDPGRYDHDAVVMLSDWLHGDPRAIIPRLRAENAKQAPAAPAAMPVAPGATMAPGTTMAPAMKMDPAAEPAAEPTMKMAGGMDLSDVKYDAFLLNGRGAQAPWTLAARPGQRVRLRLINAGSSTYFTVSLDDHALEVTHADGLPVRPVVVDRILMGMAECYDVVVRLKGSGSHTLHAVAQDGSGQAVGVLHTPDVRPVANAAIPAPGPRALSYGDLRSVEETTLPPGDVHAFRLPLQGDMRRYVWMIDGQAYPDAQPLVIRQGERVRVEMTNETGMWHPMHLHGHFFRVLTDDGPFCPLKHTVNVAPKETVRIEFSADNPGRWFFHCHNLYHLEAGMARVWEYAGSS